MRNLIAVFVTAVCFLFLFITGILFFSFFYRSKERFNTCTKTIVTLAPDQHANERKRTEALTLYLTYKKKRDQWLESRDHHLVHRRLQCSTDTPAQLSCHLL